MRVAADPASPDGARLFNVELLRQVRDFHVVARLDDLAAIRLQLPRDDLQLRRLPRAVDACTRACQCVDSMHDARQDLLQAGVNRLDLVRG